MSSSSPSIDLDMNLLSSPVPLPTRGGGGGGGNRIDQERGGIYAEEHSVDGLTNITAMGANYS